MVPMTRKAWRSALNVSSAAGCPLVDTASLKVTVSVVPTSAALSTVTSENGVSLVTGLSRKAATWLPAAS